MASSASSIRLQLHPCDVWLDALADDAREHAEAPDSDHLQAHEFPVATRLGKMTLWFNRERHAGPDDHYIGCYLERDREKDRADKGGADDADDDAPAADLCYAIVVRAVKGDERHDLGAIGGKVPSDAWVSGDGWGSPKMFTWSMLRTAVLNGFAPRATIVAFSGRLQIGADDRLRVACTEPSAAARSGQLNGPFSDVTVKATGGGFRAHRLVLAAASPVFDNMLRGVNDRPPAEIELQDTDVTSAELLMNHIYGNDIEVPLSCAIQLYDVANRYQVKSDLTWQLRLWLSAADIQPAVLCQLLPLAHRICPQACSAGMYKQAAKMLPTITLLPGYSGYWPVDLVGEVVSRAPLLPGFNAAAAWITAQPKPSGKAAAGAAAAPSPHWDSLLSVLPWPRATQEDLREIRTHEASSLVPGLHDKLWEALDSLCTRQVATAAALRKQLGSKTAGAAAASAGAADDAASEASDDSDGSGGGPGRRDAGDAPTGLQQRLSFLVQAAAPKGAAAFAAVAALTRRLSGWRAAEEESESEEYSESEEAEESEEESEEEEDRHKGKKGKGKSSKSRKEEEEREKAAAAAAAAKKKSSSKSKRHK